MSKWPPKSGVFFFFVCLFLCLLLVFFDHPVEHLWLFEVTFGWVLAEFGEFSKPCSSLLLFCMWSIEFHFVIFFPQKSSFMLFTRNRVTFYCYRKCLLITFMSFPHVCNVVFWGKFPVFVVRSGQKVGDGVSALWPCFYVLDAWCRASMEFLHGWVTLVWLMLLII